ncbi:hypothetical protein CC80DRAFT_552776 [Byssothecium circinans]|uniref:Urea active transporter n=1 Tax=Byssothecium circinans TaxID=147558 RepID=A0A6A5THE6_9PLEO|nr:hypothetical protein CC80DRAFT_552776 [Byssothecium circinans]
MSSLQLMVAGEELIPQSTGYGMLIGLGIAFCGVILIALKIQRAYLAKDSGTSEMFMVANRTWWATGLCFQIALMAALGVLAKIRVPYAHTSLEIIKMRYGWVGHVIFILLNITNNVFGCASMILTGSQLIFGISGMHFATATVLIPLGGLGGLYDKVVANAANNYIAGNYEGSVLTFKSKEAIIWALILKFGNLALVVMDTAFWQKSFATEVNATVPGYNLAALAIFGVPWCLGTVFGMTARALHNIRCWPTYPAPLTQVQVNAGLVMPYTIKALTGNKGIDAFLVLLLMALTSTVSSSMIAVSSILSFDVYKTYINPKASDKKLVRVSHSTVIFHGCFITGVALALNYGGANMTWIGYFRTILSCPGIIPLALTLLWFGQTRLAAIISPILGFFTGLSIWLGTSYSLYGEVNMTTTGMGIPALYGATASFFSPALYSVLISLYKPSKFDWRIFLRIELADEAQLAKSSSVQGPNSSSDATSADSAPKEIGTAHPNDAQTDGEIGVFPIAHDPVRGASVQEKNPKIFFVESDNLATSVPLDEVQHHFDELTLRKLHWWHRVAWIWFVVIVLVTFIAWPMPLYRDYIFTKSFFSGWVVVAIFWQFFAFAAIVVYPLYDGRYEILKGARGVWHATRAFTERRRK